MRSSSCVKAAGTVVGTWYWMIGGSWEQPSVRLRAAPIAHPIKNLHRVTVFAIGVQTNMAKTTIRSHCEDQGLTPARADH
ncbi:MAG: hypothetical protein AAF670_20060 [Planctomycetota bacterium]